MHIFNSFIKLRKLFYKLSYFLDEAYHFYGGQRTIIPFVAHLGTGSFNCLFDPEIIRMQVEAIMRAAIEVKREKKYNILSKKKMNGKYPLKK